MKVRYTFPVDGKIRIDRNFPISFDGLEFKFSLGPHNQIISLSVTIEVANKNDWPRIEKGSSPDVAFKFYEPAPRLQEIKVMLRVFEGFLCTYGLRSIDMKYFSQDWIPENSTEKANLQLYGKSASRNEIPIEKIDPLGYDVLARALLSTQILQEFEKPLIFYKNGLIDNRQGRYLEACIDFLFFVETLYANGKIKSNQVEQAYLSNGNLQNFLLNACQSHTFHWIVGYANKTEDAVYKHVYMSCDPTKITKHLIDLRGRLHHHSYRNKRAWHPDDHNVFEVDAAYLQILCYELTFSFFEPHVFSDATADEYIRQLKVSGSSNIFGHNS